MKIYVRSHDICKSNPEDIAQKAKALGFSGIQLAINKSFEGESAKANTLSDEKIINYKNIFDKYDLHVIMLGSYFNPVHSNKNLVKQNIEKFKDHLRFSKLLGTKYVGSETGSYNDDKWTYNPKNRTEEAYEIVKTTFKELSEYAKKENTNIAIEGADGHCMYCPEQQNRLIRDIDNGHVFAIIDVFNYLNVENYNSDYQNKVLDKAIELLKDKIVIFHIKDFIIEDGKFKNVGLGEGLMDLKHLIPKMQKFCPTANLVFEGVPYASMEKSLKLVNDILNKSMHQ